MPANPEETAEIIEKLEMLRNQASQQITAAQLGLLEQVSKNVERHVQQQLQRTRLWLSDLEKELEGDGELSQLQDRLHKPPMYMADAERVHWLELQKRVQEKVDRSIVAQIESKFRSIGDPEQRRACLLRLQQILDDFGSSRTV